MAIRLSEISRDRLPSQVAASIRKEIVRGNLKPGDRLPTEQSIADTLGVSRNAVREGMAQLRQAGLVISRQGVGAFVAEPDVTSTLSLGPSDLRAAEDYRSLFELRLILETGAAALAATNRTAEDLELIENAYQGMANSGIWSEDGLDHDIAFHRAIAGATRNGFVLLFIAFVDERLKDSIRLARRFTPGKELSSITLQEHAAILEALRRGEPEAARQAMTRHLNSALKRLGLELL